MVDPLAENASNDRSVVERQIAAALQRAGLRSSAELVSALVGPFQRTQQGLAALREQLDQSCYPADSAANMDEADAT